MIVPGHGRLADSADIAYYRGRSLLSQAHKLFSDGVEQLRIATQTENPHTRSAQQMLLEVEPRAVSFDEALRRAVHLLSAPKDTLPPSRAVLAPAFDDKDGGP